MSAYDTYCSAAAQRIRRPAPWRLLLGLLTVAILWIGASTVTLFALEIALGRRIGSGATVAEDLGINRPIGIVLLLCSFAAVHLALLVVARAFHKQPLAAFLSVTGRLPMREILAGAGAVALLFAAAFLVTFPFVPPVPNQSLSVWAIWLGPVLLALVIQCSAEEILFRGYVQTTLAARFRTPIVWLLLPSVAFGMLHHNPGVYGPNALLVVASAALIGLVAGDVTARTGSIAAAFGLHLANNAIGILFVATPGAFDGVALAHIDVDPGDVARMRGMILANIGLIAVGYGLYRLWLARRPALHSRTPASK